MHKAAYRVAEDQGQPSAMTQAAQNLAKLHGLIVDKQYLKAEGDLAISINGKLADV